MKSLISAFALAAVMGIAAAATPAMANTPDGSPNTCVVVNDGYHDFGEMQCTHVYPFWYTPVAYKHNGGGNFQYDNTPSDDPYCPPHHVPKGKHFPGPYIPGPPKGPPVVMGW